MVAVVFVVFVFIVEFFFRIDIVVRVRIVFVRFVRAVGVIVIYFILVAVKVWGRVMYRVIIIFFTYSGYYRSFKVDLFLCI